MGRLPEVEPDPAPVAPTRGLGLVAYGSDSDDCQSEGEAAVVPVGAPVEELESSESHQDTTTPATEGALSTLAFDSAATPRTEGQPTAERGGAKHKLDAKLADFLGELEALETDQDAVAKDDNFCLASKSALHPTELPLDEINAVGTSDSRIEAAGPHADADSEAFDATDESASTRLLREALENLRTSMGSIGISTQVQGITKWHVTLIKLATRFEDYRAGMLSARYVHTLVRGATEDFDKYRASLAPDGWQCLYDKSSRRYYYVETASGKTSWRYPSERDAVSGAIGNPAPAQTAPSQPADDPPPLPGEPPPMPDKNPPPPHEDPPPLPDMDGSSATDVVGTLMGPTEPAPKKRKKAKGSGIAKDKKMSELVAKWSQVQDKAKTRPAKPLLSVDARRDRDIEKWKAEQVEGGAAGQNPNFTPLVGDRRKRREKGLLDRDGTDDTNEND